MVWVNVDHEIAGVFECGRQGVRRFPRHVVAIAHHRRSFGSGLPHIPLDDVHQVGEQIGHGSPAEVPEPSPEIKLLQGERLVRRVPQVSLPVELRRIHRLQHPECGYKS